MYIDLSGDVTGWRVCVSRGCIIHVSLKFGPNILREKSLAIYFEDSQFRRNRTLNFIVSNIYVDKRSRVR